MREIWTSLASLMGILAFCQSLLSTIFPPSLRYTFLKFFNRISNYFSCYCYFDITEIDGVNTNELYNAVQLYLSSTAAAASASAGRLSLTRSVNSSAVTFGLAHNDILFDSFNGVSFQWEHIVTQRSAQSFSWRPVPDEKRGFTLRVNKGSKDMVLGPYLDHIMERAGEIRRQNQDRYLYTNSRGGSMDSARPGHPWEAVPFKHPSTFDTLALDLRRKAEIMADLKEFASGESFYRDTGRAWKRGYLLYGPPGTGKSSMIAAMANYLNYDIYDLEITEVGSNSELRKLLMKTTTRSIIVIEDIDCSIDLSDRQSKNRSKNRQLLHSHPSRDDGPTGPGSVTLSGLLNFTDGLWSCCGSERIFVFTTNHVEKLDPALLRSGRMDMHIELSYCCFEALKILVKNYVRLDVDEEVDVETGSELERVVDIARMTPADVSEVLIRHRREGKKAVMELLDELKRRVEVKIVKRLDSRFENEEEEEKRELEMMDSNGVVNVNVNGDDENEKKDKEGKVVLVNSFCSIETHDDENKKFD
ncbi:AAA-ATPase At5g57480-like [Amaranthus tricolor]|uniref:AAA-ATPase At5g57480-like n=1 Tax=Amaranthus tricolor TaxID=29722 RepID=UPI00258A5600|nr:AAA-ATPase At5g57480-like [Amaranthus tricolor]